MKIIILFLYSRANLQLLDSIDLITDCLILWRYISKFWLLSIAFVIKIKILVWRVVTPYNYNAQLQAKTIIPSNPSCQVCSFLDLVNKLYSSELPHPGPSMTLLLPVRTTSLALQINPHCLVFLTPLWVDISSILFWVLRGPLQWIGNGNCARHTGSNMDTQKNNPRRKYTMRRRTQCWITMA